MSLSSFPVQGQAIEWNGENTNDISQWLDLNLQGQAVLTIAPGDRLIVNYDFKTYTARKGDYFVLIGLTLQTCTPQQYEQMMNPQTP